MQPRISIVIPSYNQGMYIENTITSILNQNYHGLELIVIDGGSTDNTNSILRKYKNYLDYYVSEKDEGQAHAINKGLQRATGTYFNWINSDDYLESGALNAIAEHGLKYPNKDIICGYTRCFWDGSNENSHEYRMGLRKTVAETLLNVEMNQPGTFYKTDVVRRFDGVNASLRYVFDDELWFRYICKYGFEKIGFINSRLAHFRLHSKSKTINEGYEKFYKELQSIYIHILKETNAPEYILHHVLNESFSQQYIPVSGWDYSYIDKHKYLAYFARKHINAIYESGDLEETKSAMKLIVEQGLFDYSRMLLSIRLKLLLS